MGATCVTLSDWKLQTPGTSGLLISAMSYRHAALTKKDASLKIEVTKRKKIDLVRTNSS